MVLQFKIVAVQFFVRWLLALVVVLSVFTAETAVAGGTATITPQFIIMSSKDRSQPVSVNNPSEDNLEIWIDFKYAYNINDDSGKVTVYSPDTLQPDDPSAASWLKAYPIRFVLGPHESQTVRITVNPPPGILDGEYWARVVLTQKPQTKSTFVKGKKLLTGINTVLVYSAPFLYRYGEVTTGLALTGSLQYQLTPKDVEIKIPLRRSGNASFWGLARCRLLDKDGKQTYAHDYKVVVYKDFTFTAAIDRSTLQAGEYSAEFELKTERTDLRKSVVVHGEPLKCSIPIRIQ